MMTYRRRRMKVLADIPGRLVRKDRLPNGAVALTFKLNDEQPRQKKVEQDLNGKMMDAFRRNYNPAKRGKSNE